MYALTHSLTGRLTALTDYELYKTRFGIYLWSYVGAVDRVAAGKLSDGKDNGGIVGTDRGGKPKICLKNVIVFSFFTLGNWGK